MQKSPSSSEKVFIKCTHTFIALSTLQKIGLDLSDLYLQSLTQIKLRALFFSKKW